MSIVRTRLDRLEKQMGSHGVGKLIAVRCGLYDEELDAMLAEQGIDSADPRHIIIILQTFTSQQVQAEILSITELK